MKKSVVQRNASIAHSNPKTRKTHMKKTIFALLLAAAVSCGLFSQEARADFISFTGTASANGASASQASTTVSFSNPWTVLSAPAPTGVFAGTGSSSATFTSFTFSGDGSGAACTTCPQTLWSFTKGVNSYSFTMTSITNFSTTSSTLSGAGAGYATVNGVRYLGSWSITSSSGSNFTYSFSFATSTVPDGGSAVALLGVGLTAVESVRRLLRRRSA
jgi:hypothetical protein